MSCVRAAASTMKNGRCDKSMLRIQGAEFNRMK